MAKLNIFNDILSYENNVSSMMLNLSEYALFKKELLAFLGLDLNYKDVEIYTEVNLQLEKSKKSFGRIDLMIIDNENNEYLVENKIKNDRDLTENQIEQYVKYIDTKESAKKLIFLIPKNYAHLKTVQALQNDNDNIVEIKFWQDFVKKFKSSEIYELNQFIEAFIDFLEDWFMPRQVKFSYMEIKIIKNNKDVMMNETKIATIMKKLIEIVENVNAKKLKYRPTSYEDSYGYAIDKKKYNINNDEIFIWYGIDYNIWEEYGYPLIIWVENYNKDAEVVLKDDGFKDDEEAGLMFPFNNLEDEDIIETVRNKISEVIDKLAKI